MVDMLSANGVTSQGVESSISIDALTNELSNMRPVILGYQGGIQPFKLTYQLP